MSLRSRLTRRKTEEGNGAAVAPPLAPPPASPAALDDLSTIQSTPTPPPAPPRRDDAELSAVDRLKVSLHRRLVDRLDLKALDQIRDEREVAAQIRRVLADFLRGESTPLSQGEREHVIEEIVDEVTGLGPLETLFRDPTVSDILVNGPHEIWVERRGQLSRVDTTFRDEAHLLSVIDRIVSRVGRRVDESSPMVDARLPDGSRVNAVIPPLALDGPVLSIRRFETELDLRQLMLGGALTAAMARFLAACVRARMNVLVSGGTGSGKTTLLNALSGFIPGTERIITIEDAAELRLKQEHVVRLETRPANVEGRGEVVARDLVRNALRMRPNRIIIGEVRGAEALDMLQAMNTGHEGSLTTIHANTPRDALARMETMVMMAGMNLPAEAIRDQVASAIHVIVQVARLADGTRRVVSITEVTGQEGSVVTTQEIFRYHQRGISPDGRVLGRFEATGIRPLVSEKLAVAGVPLPVELFDPRSDGGTADDLQRVFALSAAAHAGLTAGRPATRALPAGEPAAATAMPTPTAAASEPAPAARPVEPPPAIPDEALAAKLRTLQREAAAARAEADAERKSVAAARAAHGAALARLRDGSVAMMAFLEALDDVTALARRDAEGRIARRVDRLQRRADAIAQALGLTEIDAAPGQPVDPEAHEVVEPADGEGGDGAAGQPGRIVRLVQRGYRADGRVIRKAQVVVGG